MYTETEITNGCVVACLAMILGKKFNDVIKDIEQHWKNEAQFDGVDDPCWIEYLSSLGYAIQDVNYEYVPQDRLLNPWPIKPFAPIHMCFVYDEGPHAIVMDADGKIYDPDDDKLTDLSQYYRVYRIVGIWKVREPLIL